MAHPLGSTNTLELENGTICSIQENGGWWMKTKNTANVHFLGASRKKKVKLHIMSDLLVHEYE